MGETKRKIDHIELARDCQTMFADERFNYEPLLSPHPNDMDISTHFIGKRLSAPLWISSVTGGSEVSNIINKRLAKAASMYGLGLALGSCRPLLEKNTSRDHFEDFNLRHIIGSDLPFYANLGISQIEQLIASSEVSKIIELVKRLEVDGLIIHVNPLQEWLQPEGDRLKVSPIDSIKVLMGMVDFPIIVKEVGQGMGPKSLEALIRLPIKAIEFAAFGGTNFSMIEQARGTQSHFDDLSKVGHTAIEMVDHAKYLVANLKSEALCRNFIISGGVTPLDGYYLLKKLRETSVIGHAYIYAEAARESYERLSEVIEEEIGILKLAYSYLELKE